MSKFIPDPQIQSLRPMRAGDIAFANGGTITIGKQSVAIPQPIVTQSKSLTTVPSTEAIAGTPSESPMIGEATGTLLSQDTAISVNVGTTNALETLSGTPSESPTVGVGTSTSVS